MVPIDPTFALYLKVEDISASPSDLLIYLPIDVLHQLSPELISRLNFQKVSKLTYINASLLECMTKAKNFNDDIKSYYFIEKLTFNDFLQIEENTRIQIYDQLEINCPYIHLINGKLVYDC